MVSSDVFKSTKNHTYNDTGRVDVKILYRVCAHLRETKQKTIVYDEL